MSSFVFFFGLVRYLECANLDAPIKRDEANEDIQIFEKESQMQQFTVQKNYHTQTYCSQSKLLSVCARTHKLPVDLYAHTRFSLESSQIALDIKRVR